MLKLTYLKKLWLIKIWLIYKKTNETLIVNVKPDANPCKKIPNELQDKHFNDGEKIGYDQSQVPAGQ